MLEKDINDLLQDYKHRKNILEEITLSDIEKWNNIDVDVGWDDILNKPATLEGYGITEELNSNYLNVVDNVIKNANILQWDSCVGGFISKKSSSYSEIKVDTTYDTYMSLSIHTLTHSDKNISIRNKGIELKAQGDDGVNLYNGTVLYTGFVDGDNYSQYYPIVQQDNDNLLFGSTKIPNKMNNTLKLPRVNLYNDSNVYEGSLENDTYNIKGVLHDGLRLRHADGKYLMIGYTDSEKNTVYSYMICDVEGVLKNDSDGDDWAPIRFEQDAFFRHGLKIGGGEDIILAGKGVNTRITALENAISQGTGMVEWNNVLNKPSTFTPSIHSHTISEITKLQTTLDGKASSTHNHDTVYSKLGHTHNYASSSSTGGPADSALNSLNTGVIWTSTTTVGTWSALCKFTNYSSGIFSLILDQNSQCGFDTFIVSTGWDSARIYQLGGNGYTTNSGYQLRLVKESDIQYTLEIKNDYGYNGTKTLDVQCRYIVTCSITSTNPSLIKYTTFCPSSGKTEKVKITTSPNYMVGFISNALKDSEGNIIKDTYLKKSGGSINGTVNFEGEQKFTYTYHDYSDPAPGVACDIKCSGNLAASAIYEGATLLKDKYLSLAGGTLTGDITLSNSKAIKGKNNSGTDQDLIKLGIYATSAGSTQTTILGNSNYPTISVGNLYEGNYRVLNSNNFTNYCPKISDLDNYALLGHSHMQISSQGRKAPMTGRNAISGIYCYSTSGSDSTGSTMPSNYCVVIGFGDGTGGSAEIAISYTGNGMWYRYLRDWRDNWSSWVQIK